MDEIISIFEINFLSSIFAFGGMYEKFINRAVFRTYIEV